MATSNLTVENWFQTTLSSGITSTDTTIPLNNLPAGQEGYLVIEPDSTTNREIIYFTSKTGSAVVCTSAAVGRGVDGTTAVSHASGSTVKMNIVGAYWKQLQNGTAFNIGALSGTDAATGWLTNILPSVSSVTANGNRSYDITFASSVASTLSSGMRLRTTRTVSAPTQCTSLNGTTQYWSKTTPNKLTFTDDFVVSAWVKVTSYAAGTLVSRYNGTSGWAMSILSTGQIQLAGFNAGAGNNSLVVSYQSLPLNKWVHVTAQLDMSTFTATTTTSYVMFDGKDVPATVTRAGTNPTALVQAGDLQIGAANGGTFFPGKIAQVAIYNAKVTQATILASISQGLSGSETSLASAYSFNNSFADLNTTTPNDLTANGSAVATNADSPFGNAGASGTLDYSLVMSVLGSTATVQVPEGETIPTSGGVASAAYSVQGNPYGWPSDKSRWAVQSLNLVDVNNGAGTADTLYNVASFQLLVPVGSFRINAHVGVQNTSGVSNNKGALAALSTSAGNSFIATTKRSTFVNASTEVRGSFTTQLDVLNTTATPYYVNVGPTSQAATALYLLGANHASFISAEPTGL